ncbi:MAG: NAD(P)H-dependent glycerol-3-phosphate dehydrogenase [Isosphaeraceae bacterium]|nr:NAD(P)H-dependent glycerol-3-phosphate dehydrogenase [Isosphaeraceae bacterium]
MNRIAILGTGGMGTALALLFAARGKSVRLWARSPEQASRLASDRENRRHLPGVRLPDLVEITHDAGLACGEADLIVAAIPSAFLRATLESIADRVPGGTPMLSVIKGIETSTFARPSRILVETLGDREAAILSGPGHAEELARGLPASMVVAGTSESLCVAIRDALSGDALRLYTNRDPVGVELAGALKNVLGIAAGICEGLGFGDNAKAALLTRGLVEMARFGTALGGDPSTFQGLAGIGDVITTCYSPYGRNRAVGRAVGEGRSLAEVLGGMVNVAEGVPTCRSLYHLSRAEGVEMPISDEVHRILFEGKSPRSAVAALMLRDPKGERST